MINFLIKNYRVYVIKNPIFIKKKFFFIEMIMPELNFVGYPYLYTYICSIIQVIFYNVLSNNSSYKYFQINLAIGILIIYIDRQRLSSINFIRLFFI